MKGDTTYEVCMRCMRMGIRRGIGLSRRRDRARDEMGGRSRRFRVPFVRRRKRSVFERGLNLVYDR